MAEGGQNQSSLTLCSVRFLLVWVATQKVASPTTYLLVELLYQSKGKAFLYRKDAVIAILQLAEHAFLT